MVTNIDQKSKIKKNGTKNEESLPIGGLGVDIVEIERFRGAMERHPGLINRVFNSNEQSYCFSRKRPHFHFAARFATKEAVLKALGTGRRGVGWKDVEVERTEKGSPQIKLHNNASELTDVLGIKKVMVSLSFSHNSAVAMAIAVRG